jgi:hypothetical protein
VRIGSLNLFFSQCILFVLLWAAMVQEGLPFRIIEASDSRRGSGQSRPGLRRAYLGYFFKPFSWSLPSSCFNVASWRYILPLPRLATSGTSVRSLHKSSIILACFLSRPQEWQLFGGCRAESLLWVVVDLPLLGFPQIYPYSSSVVRHTRFTKHQ